MSDKHFHLKLDATYSENKNKIDDLNLEVLHEKKWEPLVDLGIHSPGFLLFINALFSCQHLYMRANCAERDLVLESAHGELQVDTSATWEIKHIDVLFNARLKSGQPTRDDLNYITERMRHCPVSTNLPAHIQLNIKVNLA